MKKQITAYFITLTLLVLIAAAAAPARADPVLDLLTAAEQPVFRQGHTLTPLATWVPTGPGGPNFSFEVRKELADHWGYALQFGRLRPSLVADLDDPDSTVSKVCALAASDPEKYPLHVITAPAFSIRGYVNSLPDATWCRDAAGHYILNASGDKVWSPEAPAETSRMIADYEQGMIQAVQAKAPIAILTNGGEYGLRVYGHDGAYWEQDPAVLAAKGGQSWFDYISRSKARQEQIITDRMRALVPQRDLYIYYYTSGSSGAETATSWTWQFDYQHMRTISDVPNNSLYYGHYNTGFTGDNDMLTQALKSIGENRTYGQEFSYNWTNAGFTLSDLDPNPRYDGYLKSYYMAGMTGGVAGYFAYIDPTGWMWQFMALGKTQALFSWLEPFVRNSELLEGPNPHVWDADQPAYEFPTGDPKTRVLVRRHNDRDEWLISAWKAGGAFPFTEVSVDIPDLGTVTLTAPWEAQIYVAHLEDGLPVVRTFVPSPLMMPGDMDGSGAVNNDDVAPFVLALTDRAAYEAHYPLIDADMVGDIDGSGAFNNNDITPFVGLLTGGPQAVPEPATISLMALGGLVLLRRRRK